MPLAQTTPLEQVSNGHNITALSTWNGSVSGGQTSSVKTDHEEYSSEILDALRINYQGKKRYQLLYFIVI